MPTIHTIHTIHTSHSTSNASPKANSNTVSGNGRVIGEIKNLTQESESKFFLTLGNQQVEVSDNSFHGKINKLLQNSTVTKQEQGIKTYNIGAFKSADTGKTE